MKSFRLLTLFMVLAIALSVWTPAAAASSTMPDLAKKVASKTAQVNVTNRTGGWLYVSLTSVDGKTPNYFFVVADKDRDVYTVQNGTYMVSLHTSGCSGAKTKRARITGKSYSLGTWVCRRR